MKRIVMVAMAALSVAGCTTAYQREGFTGGYSDSKITRDTFQINFQGNGYTSVATVRKYALFRCAEVTLENGYEYFFLVGGDRGGSASRLGNSYLEHAMISIQIRCGHGPAPEDAYDAREIIENLQMEVLGKKWTPKPPAPQGTK